MTDSRILPALVWVLLADLLLIANSAKAQKVVFIGDSITLHWRQAFSTHPNWINKGSSGAGESYYGGEPSEAMLARFPSDVVNLHPAIVHILAGAVDASIVDDASRDIFVQNFATNIREMVGEAKAAGIKVILGTIPPQLVGDGFGPIYPLVVFQSSEILQINAWIESYGQANYIPVVNYHDVLCSCIGSTNPGLGGDSPNVSGGFSPNPLTTGFDPTALGYAAMTPLAETAVETALLTLKSGFLGDEYLPEPLRAPERGVNSVPQGKALQFTAYGVYSDGTAKAMVNTDFSGLNGYWTSSNPAVMYVGYDGKAYAFASGKATISFKSLNGIHFSPWIMTVE